jgi:hypothetical protein
MSTFYNIDSLSVRQLASSTIWLFDIFTFGIMEVDNLAFGNLAFGNPEVGIVT